MANVFLNGKLIGTVKNQDKMIKEVKKNIDIPLIVGGGIRDFNTAKNIALAGADIIVTGTTLEEDVNLKKTLTDIIKTLEL